jgi:hypothetical protein
MRLRRVDVIKLTSGTAMLPSKLGNRPLKEDKMRARKGRFDSFVRIAAACGAAVYIFGAPAFDRPTITQATASGTANGGSGPRIWDLMPANEQAFIKAVLAGAEAYREAKDDAQKGAARAARAKQLCDIAQVSDVSRWIASIKQFSSDADGKGAVTLQITQDVYVKTWADASADAQDKTLIAADDPLLAKLPTLKERKWMRFSGEFAKSDADCLKEAGATIEASMTTPEFIFKFRDAAPL